MTIWQRSFWKSYWLALQRVRTDKRARSFAFRVTFVLLYWLGYLGFLGFLELSDTTGGHDWNAVFYTLMLGGGSAAAVLLRRSHRRQDAALNFSLTGQSHSVPKVESDASPEIRTYLEQRALIVASLLARGAGESYQKRNRMPEDVRVVNRQVQNAFLRTQGLWDKLEPEEAALAATAEGDWTLEQTSQVVVWGEQLRLLRWVLRVDSELMPLEHFPKLDFSLSRDVMQNPVAAFPQKPLLKPWEVRVQRDLSTGYAVRTFAELAVRGLITHVGASDEWAQELRTRSLGASTDSLAGARTIAELDDESLQLLGSITSTRREYLRYLTDLLDALEPFSYSSWMKSKNQTIGAG